MKKGYLLPLALLAFSAVLAIQSPGFFEHDEIPHFLKAREALHDWKQLLDIWGRPACTGLFSIGAAIGGLAGARLLAVVITGLTGCGATLLMRTLQEGEESPEGVFGRFAGGWLWLLLYAQPLFLLNSFTVMTEMLLACAWVWAAVLLVRGRTVWAGLLLGLGGLARPEGWLALAAWPIFLWLWHRLIPAERHAKPRLRRVIISVAASVLPVAVWWATGAIAYHNAGWMISSFPWQPHSQYGRTGLLLLLSLLLALAFWMWIPLLVGGLTVWHRKDSRRLLILVLPIAAFFLLHGVLGIFGWMGSMSLPRYFICVAPFVAVLTLGGLQTMERHARRPRLLRKVATILILLPGMVLLLSGELPAPLSTNARQLDVAIRAFRERVPRDRQPSILLANDPYVFYRLGLPMDTPFADRIFTDEGLRTAPPGTFLITDSLLWNREGRPSPQQLAEWGYRYDPLVDRDVAAVVPSFDLEALGANRWPPHMGVALWIKDR